MSDYFTTVKPLKVGLNLPDYRKWDIIKTPSGESIVIGFLGVIGDGANYSTTYVLYPYRRKKTKFGRWFWLKWLKVKICLGFVKDY